MDIQSALNNQTVKDILGKIGVGGEQQEKVVSQAVDLVKSKALSDPRAITSLFSSKPNTAKDTAFQSGLQTDFLNDLISKVGLPADLAKKVSGSLPELLKGLGSSKGFDLSSLTGILDAFSGEPGKKKGSDSEVIGVLSKFLRK